MNFNHETACENIVNFLQEDFNIIYDEEEEIFDVVPKTRKYEELTKEDKFYLRIDDHFINGYGLAKITYKISCDTSLFPNEAKMAIGTTKHIISGCELSFDNEYLYSQATAILRNNRELDSKLFKVMAYTAKVGAKGVLHNLARIIKQE